MVSVLLVQPPHRDTFGYSMPPLGPLHLGGAARARGHEVAFLDLALLVRRGELPLGEALVPACAERIAAAGPDVVGLGAMISSMPAALHLAAEVRRQSPETLIILGGQGPETVEEAVVARHPAIDAVAVGEADVTFVEWLDWLQPAGPGARPDPADLAARHAACDVPGLVVRRDGRPHRTSPRPVLADLDAVAPPAWDLAESPDAYRRAAGGDEALFPIDLGRGCTYACTFCTTPVFWGRRARHLSPARAADELDRLAALPGIGAAYVTHDLFTADRQRVLAICREKIARGNTLPWECRTRLDLVDGELLEALREAGCRRILYGVESDSVDVLARVNKGGRQQGTAARAGGATGRLDVRAALADASARGMASIVGTMAGIPGETRDDVEANLRLMAEVAVLDGVSLSLHWFNVTPGNARAGEAGAGLGLVPGVTADLVRGFDLPAGFVPEAQRRMIADDPELFAAFRVFTPGHLLPAQLYRLTRNAHVLLEALPRTARALAAARHGGSLLDTLVSFLDGLAHSPSATAADDWDEPSVLRRRAAVRLFADHARAAGDAAVTTLADYEQALLETDAPRLLRLPLDPLPLVRAMDAGTWPPPRPAPPRGQPPRTDAPTDAPTLAVAAADDDAATGAPTAATTLLFTRRGDRVAAARVSPFLADAASEPDDEVLLARWPAATAQTVRRARALLAERLGGDGRRAVTSCPPPPATPPRGDAPSLPSARGAVP